jgi:hypothetical protein
MKLNELQWTDLDLVPAERLMGGVSEKDWSDAEVKIADPVVLDAVAYNRYAGTADAAMELLRDAHDFYYIRVPLSIRPPSQWRIRLLTVKFNLTNESGSIEAWSMVPEKVESERKVSTSAKFSPSLKIYEMEVSAGEIGAEQDHVVYLPVVQAYDLGSATPMWEFIPQAGRELRGIQLMHLVVRQTKGSASSGQIHLGVELERSGGILRRLFAREKGSLGQQLSFSCPRK